MSDPVADARTVWHQARSQDLQFSLVTGLRGETAPRLGQEQSEEAHPASSVGVPATRKIAKIWPISWLHQHCFAAFFAGAENSFAKQATANSQASESPGKSGTPVAISAKMQVTDQISVLGPYCSWRVLHALTAAVLLPAWPKSVSGGLYHKVTTSCV